MKKIFLILLISFQAQAADFSVEFTPENNSIGNAQISSISSSKISDFAASVLSAVSTTLNNYVLKSDVKAPTVSRLTTVGPGIYNVPAGVKYIKVRMLGGGGGGGAAGLGGNAGTGTVGGNSLFGGTTLPSAILIAYGGGPGCKWDICGAGGYGEFEVRSPAVNIASNRGNWGAPGASTNAYHSGGIGGVSVLGGNGEGSTGGRAGGAAVANSGSGGGGASAAIANSYSGGGGGSSGYVEARIDNPAASYAYVIGNGGLGGTGAAFVGGAGGSGIIIVEEFYQ